MRPQVFVARARLHIADTVSLVDPRGREPHLPPGSAFRTVTVTAHSLSEAFPLAAEFGVVVSLVPDRRA